jgi:CHAT domain-containing protein
MLAFHRGLASSLARNGTLKGKAESLRRASLELLKTPEYQHPFYWAGFQMLGDGY